MIFRVLFYCSVFILAAFAHATGAFAEQSLAIFPERVQLFGPEARQRLLVEWMADGRATGEAVENVTLASSDERIVRVVAGMAVPVANGAARIVAVSGKFGASVEVVVSGMDEPHAWNFSNHVQAVLTKSGCNSGACHGALAGKGGFRLSLRGYDSAADFHAITREARGRRIELADPGRSLILAKPTGAMPHKGGVRFEIDSPEYRILSEWIVAGAAPPSESDPKLDRIEVLPAAAKLAPGQSQRLLVLAHYDDGRVEDVTRWAKYDATNEAVARVDNDGLVTVTGHGEGAVTAWFASRIVVSRIASPYPNEIAPEVFANAERRNFIDDLVLAKLEELRLPPSPAASDEEFIRRAYLDTIGTLPTAEEVRAFLADASPDKRDALIEHLLGREEFIDYWTYKWCDVLLVSGRNLRPDAIKAYYTWIRAKVAANAPWDEMVREIITSSGDSLENGATNFYAVHQDPENMTENVSQAFLGLSIGCAKCHNHPLEKWTNDQYYGMASMFARVRAKGWGGDPRSGDGRRTLHVVDAGELMQPLTGKPQPPRPLDGEAIPFDAPGDRRVPLAAWLTAPENPYFARAVTNRVWANYFGVGLVERVDDMRLSNPASNEALLAAAAQHLIDHDFDLKALMRAILQSKTYQRTSLPLPENKDEQRYYSRYYPKRLMAEVMLDAISQVTRVPSEFNKIVNLDGETSAVGEYPLGTRAIQLHDTAVASYFLKAFGRNERTITCECERTDEPSMVQVLHISNGDTINQKLKAETSCVSAALAADKSNETILEEAYLSTLARLPTEEERAALLELLNDTQEDRRVLIEDLYWGILSSREFLFNH